MSLPQVECTTPPPWPISADVRMCLLQVELSESAARAVANGVATSWPLPTPTL